ncbi:MAG: sulfoxide reductase heme-binding subunit YedZ [Ardenticatenales bacterium]|nr:sulfoxide reductase heme-binding subunit YedZ [Ardenticatenales bacterium]
MSDSLAPRGAVLSGAATPAPTVPPTAFAVPPARRRDLRPLALRAGTHAAAAATALWLAWHAATGDLGFNPVDTVVRTLGKAALVLLVASLCCTPAFRVLGARWAIPLRRPLGLWAFAYAVGHLLAFAGLDYGFSLAFILDDGLPKKPYIVVGLSAFALLVPLALTSTRGWQKRLGRRWTRLHRLVYVAAVLAAVHFYWIGASTKKGSPIEPYVWAAGVGLLLAVRVPAVRTALKGTVGRTLGRWRRVR